MTGNSLPWGGYCLVLLRDYFLCMLYVLLKGESSSGIVPNNRREMKGRKSGMGYENKEGRDVRYNELEF